MPIWLKPYTEEEPSELVKPGSACISKGEEGLDDYIAFPLRSMKDEWGQLVTPEVVLAHEIGHLKTYKGYEDSNPEAVVAEELAADRFVIERKMLAGNWTREVERELVEALSLYILMIPSITASSEATSLARSYIKSTAKEVAKQLKKQGRFSPRQKYIA